MRTSNADTRRAKVVAVRLSSDERGRISRAAEEARLSAGDWLRRRWAGRVAASGSNSQPVRLVADQVALLRALHPTSTSQQLLDTLLAVWWTLLQNFIESTTAKLAGRSEEIRAEFASVSARPNVRSLPCGSPEPADVHRLASRVSVRFSRSEFTRLRSEARSAGLTLSDAVRNAAFARRQGTKFDVGHAEALVAVLREARRVRAFCDGDALAAADLLIAIADESLAKLAQL